MSDVRVDTLSLEKKYGLHGHADRPWSVSPIWHPGAKSKQLVTLDQAEAPADVIRGVVRIFEARTMVQHREAVEVLDHDLLWDGPPIRLSNKGHVRLAAYLFKYLAHLRVVPIVAAVSAPSAGCTLIELEAVAVSFPHRPWLLPVTWLLPAHVAKNVHLKIGVNETGKVELVVGRLTNFPAFLPFAWQRSINGIFMGAIPHSLENALGFLFDMADGGDYYARKRNKLFKARHPDSTNPTWDWLLDVAQDVPHWAAEQGSVAWESLQAIFGSTFDRIQGFILSIFNFYVWLFNTIWGSAGKVVDSIEGMVQGAAPGTAAADSTGYSPAGHDAKGMKAPAAYHSGGAARRAPMTTAAY